MVSNVYGYVVKAIDTRTTLSSDLLAKAINTRTFCHAWICCSLRSVVETSSVLVSAKLCAR